MKDKMIETLERYIKENGLVVNCNSTLLEHRNSNVVECMKLLADIKGWKIANYKKMPKY